MRAFLSHSSKDKDFVKQVAKTLGPLEFELDEKTFDLKFNVEAIRAALQRSDIFVLFLSQSSYNSTFVTEEQRAALEARGRGLLKRVLIFVIDGTSYKALPKWMQDINVVQQVGSAKGCARQIQALLLELAAAEDPGLALYMGRESEEAELRRALAVPSERTPIFLHAVGHYGIGRRTFLSRTLKKLFPRYFDVFVEITLSNFEGAEELYRKLYSLHRVASLEDAHRDFIAYSKLTIAEQAGEIASIIREMTENGELTFVVDGGGVYTDEGVYQPILSEILKQLEAVGRPSLGFIQTRMMPLSARQNYSRSFHQFVKPLSDEIVRDLISLSLKEFGIGFTEVQVAQIAEHLDGHPYNVRFAVQYIINYGLESLINDPSELVEWKNRRAIDFLSRIEFSEVESDLVAALSEYQFLASATLIEVLGGDTPVVTKAVRRLQEFCCVELRENYFHIAAPLRDAVRRDQRFHRDNGWKQRVGKLICDLVESYKGDDQIPLSIIESGTVAAARAPSPPPFLSLLVLPSHLLRIARENYDAKRWQMCVEFCRRAFAMRGRLLPEGQVELLRLWGLSAIRLGDEQSYLQTIDELRRFSGKFASRIVYFLEGFNARLKLQFDVAEEKFLQAWRLSRANESINRELASLYCKERRYADAEIHARAAYEIAPTNPYILDILAETLLGKAQIGLHVDKSELGRVLAQLRIYGDAPGSSFFLIREAQWRLRDKDRAGALKAIEQAIERTPNLPSPYFIRAEIHLALGDPDGAEGDLREIDKLLTEAGGFSEGEEASAQELKIRIMIERRQFKAAKDQIERSAFMARKVQKRLLDQLARAIAFEPQAADEKLKDWAKRRNLD